MHVLVFGDSLAYFGPGGALPADDPRLWPNCLPDARADLFAGAGWTMRDAYWELTGNPRVWELLPHVERVVVAVGGMDTLPSPLPTFLRQGFRYLRDDRLRRKAREAYLAAQPGLARLPGCPVALPPVVSASYARRIVLALRALRPHLPVLGTLPPVHRSAAHGYSVAGYWPQRRALGRCYADLEVPLVDLRYLTAGHVLGGHGNPDGMHWGWPAHAAVADAVSEALRQL